MTKNRLEKYFSANLRDDYDVWFLKLQSNMLSHQQNPGDYIILGRECSYLVECKETDALRNGDKTSFQFERFTQEQAVKSFDDFQLYHEGYLLLSFWIGRLEKSDIYLININDWLAFRSTWHKKSITKKEASEQFQDYKIVVEGTKMLLPFPKKNVIS